MDLDYRRWCLAIRSILEGMDIRARPARWHSLRRFWERGDSPKTVLTYTLAWRFKGDKESTNV